jgi:hypothetical protein
VLLLTLFAAIERHAIDVLVEAYEREAQFGLLSVAVSIELGQRGPMSQLIQEAVPVYTRAHQTM